MLFSDVLKFLFVVFVGPCLSVLFFNGLMCVRVCLCVFCWCLGVCFLLCFDCFCFASCPPSCFCCAYTYIHTHDVCAFAFCLISRAFEMFVCVFSGCFFKHVSV